MCPGNNFVFSVKTSHLKYSVLEKKSLRHSALLRWLVLVLISALLFSTYWFYDFFSGIKGLMTAELGISSEEYGRIRSEEHTSELQSRPHLVCRLLLEKKKKKINCLQPHI